MSGIARAERCFDGPFGHRAVGRRDIGREVELLPGDPAAGSARARAGITPTVVE